MLAWRQKPIISIICLASLLCFIPCCVWADALASADEAERHSQPSQRRALFIGISHYQALPHLPGAINDIAVLKHVLSKRFGFEPEQTRTLMNEEASRSGILKALRQLAQEAGPHDLVYVHYSGHGSQVRDFNGDEQDDHLDETLVPYDGRAEGIPDITDDELDEIFSRFRTPYVVVALDSCHSGTATRGVELRTRSIPPDSRVFLYQHVASNRRRGGAPLTDRHVLLTGAAAHERALDGPVDGKYFGLFSYALFKSLNSAALGISAQELFDTARNELRRLKLRIGLRSLPTPQLEAPPTRVTTPLFPRFGGQNTASLPATQEPRVWWLSVSPLTGDRVVLHHGDVLGALRGSVWGIYPRGELVFNPGQAMAYATVVDVDKWDAVAQTTPKGTFIERNARAVLIAPAPSPQSIPILLRDVPDDAFAGIATTLREQMSQFTLVNPGTLARYVVDVDGGSARLFGPDGQEEVLAIPVGSDPGRVSDLALLLERALTVQHLLAMENPASLLSVEAGIVQIHRRQETATADHLRDPIFHIRQDDEARSTTNSLQMEIVTNRDGYLTIVDVDASGGLNLLFPNPYHHPDFLPDGFVRGSRAVLIPDSLNNPNLAGFHWDITDPSGMDTIKIFLTSDLHTAQIIRDHIQRLVAATRDGGLRGASTGHLKDQTLRSLHGELTRRMTRGVVVAPDDPGMDAHPVHGNDLDVLQDEFADWTSTTLNVVIQR